MSANSHDRAGNKVGSRSFRDASPNFFAGTLQKVSYRRQVEQQKQKLAEVPEDSSFLVLPFCWINRITLQAGRVARGDDIDEEDCGRACLAGARVSFGM